MVLNQSDLLGSDHESIVHCVTFEMVDGDQHFLFVDKIVLKLLNFMIRSMFLLRIHFFASNFL